LVTRKLREKRIQDKKIRRILKYEVHLKNWHEKSLIRKDKEVFIIRKVRGNEKKQKFND
jgi:hypothetical protein